MLRGKGTVSRIRLLRLAASFHWSGELAAMGQRTAKPGEAGLIKLKGLQIDGAGPAGLAVAPGSRWRKGLRDGMIVIALAFRDSGYNHPGPRQVFCRDSRRSYNGADRRPPESWFPLSSFP